MLHRRAQLLAFLFASQAVAAPLPSVDAPVQTSQKSPKDAAVVIGIEHYPHLGPAYDVPYADRDADAFFEFLQQTRGVPKAHIHRLKNPTRDEIELALQDAADESQGGLLWFYYAGHAAASPETQDQVLLPSDLPQDPRIQPKRMISLPELQKIADQSRAKNALFVIDACHKPLGSRFAAPAALSIPAKSHTTIWTSASLGELSGPIEDAKHGAFTYAVLGALRGWADGEMAQKDGQIDLSEAHAFVARFLKELNVRSQHPQLLNPQAITLSQAKEAYSQKVTPQEPAQVSPSASSPEELYQTGMLYYEGSGFKKDLNKALSYLQPAALKGHAGAQKILGDMHKEGEVLEKSFKRAREWYEKAAKQGDASAQNSLGVLYGDGKGVAQDYAKAREWYEKAAKQGFSMAQHNLGSLYLNGNGVKQDYAKAREWYEKAAKQGFAQSQTALGFMYQKGQGVKQDYVKAREWFLKAAGQDYAPAQGMVGYLYQKGLGVEQDDITARDWFEKAAKQGYAAAQLSYGGFYYAGKGVDQDYAKAYEWFLKAAKQDFPDAQAMMGAMYYDGTGVAQDYVKAREWAEKAAKQGHILAQVMMGVIYEEGQGIAKNSDRAREWYTKAARQGNQDAKEALERLKNK